MLLRRSAPVPSLDGLVVSITPESAGWTHVGFEVYRLNRQQAITPNTNDRELCVVILSGQVDVTCDGNRWGALGSRSNPFEGAPDAVYAPPKSDIKLTSASIMCEIALCWAEAKRGVEPQLLRAQDVRTSRRGSDRTERMIRDILMEDRSAESLLVTEVTTRGGNWSSYPPHKHDTDDPPRETYLEETYYHRTKHPEGFGFQQVYTEDRALDTTLCVRDGDVVLVPRGYHPVAAAPGYDLYYLNVMAGPRRRWLVTTDPRHRWQLD
ncbi:5-deoxy-glucuronate isomerase [bacterium]|nr:MAG: 5-deoxy-glucuronate isomerase [bacterium]